MICWVFFRRCSLCRDLANTAIHLTRPLQFPMVNRDPEPAPSCGQVMTSVRRHHGHAAALMRLNLRFRCAVLLLACAAQPICAADASPLPCANEARSQAMKLLRFHTGSDTRAELDSGLKQLPSLKNPANSKQVLHVLEVWGFVYKGQYRMRFIFHRSSDGGCAMLGQEILEHASL